MSIDPADLGFDAFFSAQRDALPAEWVPARVVAEGQNSFHLLGCRAPFGDLSGRLLRSKHKLERPIVGDWVAVVDGAERASIQHLFDRRTALVRRAAGTLAEPQVIAANVDVFFVVTAANRDFNERRLERYLAAVWNSGASPVVVLNKVDLAAEREPLLEAIARVALGAPVVFASAKSGEGLDALRSYVGRGRTVGFIGSSGVGKSSLTNCLLGHELQAVGGLRDDERGRHTTTGRQLLRLEGGGMLVDTPGMRELGLLEDAGGIETSFADVLAFVERCRFRDCAHAGEPGCGVNAAVASGELPSVRLESYRKLLAEIAASARRTDAVAAGRMKAHAKKINRALRSRAKLDPKLQRDE